MKNLLVAGFALLVAGCAAIPKNGAKTLSGLYLGEVRSRTITPAQSRFLMPAAKTWSVTRMEARDIGANRYEEVYWLARGWMRIEQVYTGGFVLASDQAFRRMSGRRFAFIDTQALKIERKGDLKFADLIRSRAPCVVFTGVFGTIVGRADIYDAAVFGIYCGRSGDGADVLNTQVVTHFQNIKFR